MDEIGGQEITMPVVHPAEIWKESGRWYEIDAEMGRFKHRNGREMVLAMTHEEIIADLVRRRFAPIASYPCWFITCKPSGGMTLGLELD